MVLLAPRLDENDINSIYKQLNALEGVYFLGYHDTYKRLMIKYDTSFVKDINVIITTIEHLNKNVCTDYDEQVKINQVVHDKLKIPDVPLATAIDWYKSLVLSDEMKRRKHLVRVKQYFTNRQTQEEINMKRLSLRESDKNLANTKPENIQIENNDTTTVISPCEPILEVKVDENNIWTDQEVIPQSNTILHSVLGIEAMLVPMQLKVVTMPLFTQILIPVYLSVEFRQKESLRFDYRQRNLSEEFYGNEFSE